MSRPLHELLSNDGSNPEPLDEELLAELASLRDERAAVAEMVARAGDLRSQVSDVVYARVCKEYEERIAALQRKEAALVERLAAGVSRVDVEVAALRRQLEEARLKGEELLLRHGTGEIETRELDRRRGALSRRVAKLESDLTGAERTRASIRELLPGVPAPPPPPKSPAPSPPPSLPPAPVASPAQPAPAAVGERPVSTDRTMVASSGSLVVEMPDGTVCEFPLGVRTSLGRTAENHVRLPGVAVSRQHACVTLTAEGFVITDLDSGNGTKVNGVQILNPHKLEAGDQIQIGDARITFRPVG